MGNFSKLTGNVCDAKKIIAGQIEIQEDPVAYATDVSSTSLKIEGIQNNDLNNSSPDIIFQRDPANGNCVNGNYCGEIHFKGSSDAASMVNFGGVNCFVQDPANGAQKGHIITQVAAGDGSTQQGLVIRGGTKGTSANGGTANVWVKSGPLVYAGDLATPTVLPTLGTGTTPSVAGGNVFLTQANSSPTTITSLTDGIIGQLVIIKINSATHIIDINDGGNFALAGNWDPDAVGETITLICYDTNKWAEVCRSNNAD